MNTVGHVFRKEIRKKKRSCQIGGNRMELNSTSLVTWLLKGDISVQYQTHRDLLDSPTETTEKLRKRIPSEGWGKSFLDKRDNHTGLWGKGLYSPKWISTHYTLLDLKNIGLDPSCPHYAESGMILLDGMWTSKGQVKKYRYQDLCVCAMVLGMCCYGKLQSEKLNEIADYILEKQYPDGGWNCRWDKGALHSSLHTTLSVLEAFRDYEANGYSYRLAEIKESIHGAWEFILTKKLFRSARSGEIIDQKMLMLSYPCRWKYDILRCMDYFASVRKGYDERMEEALGLIIDKKRKNNRWPVQHKHAGIVYFDMEQTGGDSRWNTLRVLRMLRFYRPELYNDLIQYKGEA